MSTCKPQLAYTYRCQLVSTSRHRYVYSTMCDYSELETRNIKECFLADIYVKLLVFKIQICERKSCRAFINLLEVVKAKFRFSHIQEYFLGTALHQFFYLEA